MGEASTLGRALNASRHKITGVHVGRANHRNYYGHHDVPD